MPPIAEEQRKSLTVNRDGAAGCDWSGWLSRLASGARNLAAQPSADHAEFTPTENGATQKVSATVTPDKTGYSCSFSTYCNVDSDVWFAIIRNIGYDTTATPGHHRQRQ